MAAIDEVRVAIARMNSAIATGDTSAIATLYTEDARFLPDGAPRIDGRSGVEDFFKQAADAGFNDLVLETQDVLEVGGRVIEIGRASSAAEGGESGKYVIVWRRDRGVLKIEIDIFNSDSRPGRS